MEFGNQPNNKVQKMTYREGIIQYMSYVLIHGTPFFNITSIFKDILNRGKLPEIVLHNINIIKNQIFLEIKSNIFIGV